MHILGKSLPFVLLTSVLMQGYLNMDSAIGQLHDIDFVHILSSTFPIEKLAKKPGGSDHSQFFPTKERMLWAVYLPTY